MIRIHLLLLINIKQFNKLPLNLKVVPSRRKHFQITLDTTLSTHFTCLAKTEHLVFYWCFARQGTIVCQFILLSLLIGLRQGYGISYFIRVFFFIPMSSCYLHFAWFNCFDCSYCFGRFYLLEWFIGMENYRKKLECKFFNVIIIKNKTKYQ